MQIIHHKPAARGVSQLMYVGDVVETATPPSSLEMGLGVVGIFAYVFGSKYKGVATAGLITAIIVGARYWSSRR